MSIRKFISIEYNRIYGDTEAEKKADVRLIKDIGGKEYTCFNIPFEDKPSNFFGNNYAYDSCVKYEGKWILRGEKMTQFPIKRIDPRWANYDEEIEKEYRERYEGVE